MAEDASTFKNVEFSTYLWSRAYAALQMVTLREKGHEGIIRLKYDFMNGHGKKHFLAGLDKLGIRNDPPAVAAAKYHYMGNDLIGDVPMEYVRETDRKVWIRYLAPAWAYSGSGLLACPASVQLGSFKAWHRNNGTWLGCPRLGYVCTKLYQYGDPYDEGYFIEYDADIPLEQAFKFQPVSISPDFDRDAAPKLDPAEWPDVRLLKARRRYAESYAAVPAQVLIEMYGVPYASYLVEQGMLGLGTQYARAIADRMGISERSAGAIASLFFEVLRTLGDEVQLAKNGDRYEITRSTFSPIQENEVDEMFDAYFAMFTGMLKVLTAHVRLARSVERRNGRRTEVWCLSNSDRRLF
ncbi:hypothetical protein ACNJX9_34655 [Bradyrhizobium sp. DASA03076]|uniref:hypothetical protein n=1 Tax=Bradyrhizobium sp. BLXBL-03 TaxID=3395916 RepID=UPI003F707174